MSLDGVTGDAVEAVLATTVPLTVALPEASVAFASLPDSIPMRDLTLEEAASIAPETASFNALANDLRSFVKDGSDDVRCSAERAAGVSTNSMSSSPPISSDLFSNCSSPSNPWDAV